MFMGIPADFTPTRLNYFKENPKMSFLFCIFALDFFIEV